MNSALLLGATAGAIGVVHTLAGPDHYLPFTVLARARGWGAGKTAWITALCGLGHVASSVALGLVGIWAGLTVNHLAGLEEARGSLASWGLLILGLVYGVWGLKRAARSRRHDHPHPHPEAGAAEEAHAHDHDHRGGHLHLHGARQGGSLTPWVLFIVFLFGPCEPLIPLVMATYAASGTAATAWVALVFSLATVATMLAVVLPATAGLARLPFGRLEPYSHAMAGWTIAACGFGMVFLGL